ncbi:MAG: hypothetical protein WCO25_03040 [Candidatus Uhrbacteria bacterium]
MRLIAFFLSFLPKRKTVDELNAEVRDQLSGPILEALFKRATDPVLRAHPTDCPYGIAVTLRADVNKVDMVCASLEADGRIRRAAKQTVQPDEDGLIPHLYTQYELPGASA